MGNIAILAKYLPFFFSEVAKHPHIVDHLQKTIAALEQEPMKGIIADWQALWPEVSQVIDDTQQAAQQLAQS